MPDGAACLAIGQTAQHSLRECVSAARGRVIPSRMEVRGHEIRLLVEDRDAQYPLVVDPTWSGAAELTAADGGQFNWFGFSISVSGGTALVGAYQHTVGTISAQGLLTYLC